MTPCLRNTRVLLTAFLMYLSIGTTLVWAHGEALEAGEGGPKGPIQITAEQANILAIEVAKATNRPMAQRLTLNGQIHLLPDAQADVSVRISGAITKISAHLGDRVVAGQPLATVQSRLIGNPPPSVEVKAPIAGVIDARNVNLGQAVEPNTVLFHISNRDQLQAIAQVYEEDLGKIKIGQAANIQAISYPNHQFPGKVTLIEPNLTPVSRTVNVRISLANPEGLLKPGMFVRAQIILSRNATSLTVPNGALLQADNQSFVFVRKGNTYDRVVVQVGASDDNTTEITSGLAAGDEVVIQGNRELYAMWLSGGSKPTMDHMEGE